MKKDKIIVLRIEKILDDFLTKKANEDFSNKSQIVRELIIKEYKSGKTDERNK